MLSQLAFHHPTEEISLPSSMALSWYQEAWIASIAINPLYNLYRLELLWVQGRKWFFQSVWNTMWLISGVLKVSVPGLQDSRNVIWLFSVVVVATILSLFLLFPCSYADTKANKKLFFCSDFFSQPSEAQVAIEFWGENSCQEVSVAVVLLPWLKTYVWSSTWGTIIYLFELWAHLSSP